MDNRISDLAKQIVNYSLQVKAKEKILINAIGVKSIDLAAALVKEIYSAGAFPYYELEDEAIIKEIVTNCSEEQMDDYYDKKVKLYESMDKFIRVGAMEDEESIKTIPKEKLFLYMSYSQKLAKVREDKQYVVLKFPTNAMAKKARMTIEEFKNFYYKIVLLDYENLSKSMHKLKRMMEKTDKVRLVAQDTDLSFSIKGINVISCEGTVNLPDGEVFTAPIKDSVNGHIKFNTKCSYYGAEFDDLYLEFKDGKIINATADNTEELNKILDIDEGARFIGEFALGVNPHVTTPMNDILYDEKIAGSIHFTPGAAYPIADNGNKSRIHWDMVLMMTKKWGGGEIYFDDVLIQKDGVFTDRDLDALNPII